MKAATTILILFFLSAGSTVVAQYDAPLFASYTTSEARLQLNERVIQNIIVRNLNYPLHSDTEENWQDAFTAMEVYKYNSAFTTARVALAFTNAYSLSINFQRALLEVAFTNYPAVFEQEVLSLMQYTNNPRNFAMCAEYLLAVENTPELRNRISKAMVEKFNTDVKVHPILAVLYNKIHVGTEENTVTTGEILKAILQTDFLPGKTVMFSFQRPDRNYPGLTIFRNGRGDFVRDSLGIIISIPQLARSITNLPFYLRNGNTPQGIYRMYGFGVSMSHFIGPTANVQLGMPWELSKKAFLDDRGPLDSTWTIENYRNLLPGKLKNYNPLFESYYAGMIGRNEIIAHGTTLDPELYTRQPYYPLTPTMGCLTTKEIWDGNRIESDQQKLINALLKAGGGKGFAIVVDIENRKEAVSIGEILPYLK